MYTTIKAHAPDPLISLEIEHLSFIKSNFKLHRSIRKEH